ncbi:MAG: hypothetical protein ACE5MH_01990 [Terriglobia bacterium]
MPRKPTPAQVELFLRLYELRREAKLRTARDWFINNFFVESLEDYQRLAPPGSEENAYVRMTLSYWEMACDLLHLGLLPEELFLRHAAEFYNVWLHVQPLVGAMRQQFRNPHAFAALEKAAQRYEKWTERRAPGSLEIFRQFVKQAAEQKRRAAAS